MASTDQHQVLEILGRPLSHFMREKRTRGYDSIIALVIIVDSYRGILAAPLTIEGTKLPRFLLSAELV